MENSARAYAAIGFTIATFLVLYVLLFSFSASAYAATYYVDATGGNDSNDGLTTGTAWKAISKVNGLTCGTGAGQLGPGDSVLFKGGEEWWETLVVPCSGTSEDAITFGAYGSGPLPSINSSNAYRYNHVSLTEYSRSGIGHNPASGYTRNGNFELYTSQDFDYWSEVISGTTATVTVSTTTAYSGAASAQLYDGDGYARLQATFYLVANQAYEFSYWVKSDGAGTATTRFYQASNGLANASSSGVYGDWSGQQNITELAVTASDTDWTQKKIIISVDSSNHPVSFQVTSATANQSVWVDNIQLRPLWTQYSGNVWMTAYEQNYTGIPWMVSFDGIPTKAASDANSVTGTERWHAGSVGTTHDYVLYVHSPTGSPATSSETIDVVTTTGSITIDGNGQDNIILENLAAKNGYYVVDNLGDSVEILGTSLSVGVYIADLTGSYNSLRDSTVSHGDWMIIWGESLGTVIEGNTVYGARKFAPGATGGEGGGIAEYGGTAGPTENVTIEDNVIYDNESYGIAFYGTATGTLRNWQIRNNRIHDSLYGIWEQSESQGTDNVVVSNNVISKPKPGASIGLRAYRSGNTAKFYNNTVVEFDSGMEARINPSGQEFGNNIYADSIAYHVNDEFNGSYNVAMNHNIYSPDGPTKFSWYSGNYDLVAWQNASGQDARSLTTSPTFTNTSGTFSTTSDFSLRYSSPAIDAGTTTALHTATSTDFYGNPIYGTPDIGAIEYQPPYVTGTHDVPATGAIRLYADGKFRERVASTTAATSDLAVTPQGGWGSGDYREYMDLQIDAWTAMSMAWTATSSVATTTVFTMGGLTPNGWYNVQLDAATSSSITGATCTDSVCQANGSGVLAFTYSGSWSTHSFEVTPGSNPSPSAPGGGGSLLNPGRGKGGKKNTSPSAEDALPVDATTTNAVNAPICTLEEETTTGEVSLVAFVKLLFTTGIIPADKQERACDALTSAKAAPSAPAAAAGSFRFSTPLAKGMRSEEVRRLQQFLNTQGFSLTDDGLGAPGKETDLFGLLTDDAVKRFQAAYAAEILVPVGLTAPSGFFGPSSIRKANALLSGA